MAKEYVMDVQGDRSSLFTILNDFYDECTGGHPYFNIHLSKCQNPECDLVHLQAFFNSKDHCLKHISRLNEVVKFPEASPPILVKGYPWETNAPAGEHFFEGPVPSPDEP